MELVNVGNLLLGVFAVLYSFYKFYEGKKYRESLEFDLYDGDTTGIIIDRLRVERRYEDGTKLKDGYISLVFYSVKDVDYKMETGKYIRNAEIGKLVPIEYSKLSPDVAVLRNPMIYNLMTVHLRLYGMFLLTFGIYFILTSLNINFF